MTPHRYVVKYPVSGKRLRLRGLLRVVVDPAIGPMPMVDDGDTTVVLDPRAVVRDETGVVVYTPRMVALDEHTRAMRDWLVKHPSWGRAGAGEPA